MFYKKYIFCLIEKFLLNFIMKKPYIFAHRGAMGYCIENTMESFRKAVDMKVGIETDVHSRSIDVLVSRLRQKLNDNPKNPEYIKTVWGSGYLFLG